MKTLLAVTLPVFAAMTVSGDPSDRVALAAMRLSEQSNYSWNSTVTDDARTYDIDGKTERNGCTWLRLPMVKPIAQRLGRDADTHIEAIFRGAVCVIRTPSGWKNLAELPRRSSDWNDCGDWCPAPPGRAGGLWAQNTETDPDPFSALLPFARASRDDDDEDQPYSNAQFAAWRPHDDLAIIVSSLAEIGLDGDTIVGRLTDTGARLLLAREGEPCVTPVCAAGVFKLSIRHGIVTRMLVRLEGTVLTDGRRIRVHQITNTAITSIGTTRLDLGDEALSKLGG